jgi:ABC-type multidrug transport system fused ATPase/permease subunit
MDQGIHWISTAINGNDLWLYIGVYISLSVISYGLGSTRSFVALLPAIWASRNLFNKLTYAILWAPIRWLDTVPVGRILNRFIADFNLIDSKLGYAIDYMVSNIFEVLGIIIAGLFVSPLLLVFAAILLGFCLRLATTYLAGARETKRLESNAKSPIFEQFDCCTHGASDYSRL